MLNTSTYIYRHNDEEFNGFLAFKEGNKSPRPGVLVAHDWSGRNEFACEQAERLAELGYIGFALDVYGKGRQGSTNDEKMALMNPLVSDRNILRERLRAGFEVFSKMAEVDKNRIAIIGFCFGGLCALDLARSGADIKGAVSFHGLLNKPEHLKNQKIKAKILALHGYEDPLAKADQVKDFCKEMTEANVDWQIHLYGGVQHAFTNPLAHDVDLGLVHNPLAAQRSWMAMTNFLDEIFK